MVRPSTGLLNHDAWSACNLIQSWLWKHKLPPANATNIMIQSCEKPPPINYVLNFISAISVFHKTMFVGKTLRRNHLLQALLQPFRSVAAKDILQHPSLHHFLHNSNNIPHHGVLHGHYSMYCQHWLIRYGKSYTR